MGLIAAWSIFAGAVALTLAFIVLPGYVLIRLSRIPVIISLSLGPAVSLALVWVASFVALLGHWRFGLGLFLGVWALSILVVILIRSAVLRMRWWRTPRSVGLAAGAIEKIANWPERLLNRRFWIFFLVAGILALGSWIFALADPTRPSQAWDAIYHLAALQNILDTGYVNTFDAVPGIHGAQILHNSFYPLNSHALMALVGEIEHFFTTCLSNWPGLKLGLGQTFLPLSQASAVITLNGSALAISWLWICQCGLLTCAFAWLVFSRERGSFGAWLVAGTLAGAIVSGMPVVQIGPWGQWPYSLAMAVFPGILGSAFWLAGIYRYHAKAIISAPVVALFVWGALGSFGASVTHFSVFFVLLLAVLALVLALLWRAAYRQSASMQGFLGILAVLCIAGYGGFLWLLAYLSPAFSSVMHYSRKTENSLLYSLLKILLDAPLTRGFYPSLGLGIILVFWLCVGLWQARRAPGAHWLRRGQHELARRLSGEGINRRQAFVNPERSPLQFAQNDELGLVNVPGPPSWPVLWLMVLGLEGWLIAGFADCPYSILQFITGPWYRQSLRLVAVFWAAVMPFIALGILSTYRYLVRVWKAKIALKIIGRNGIYQAGWRLGCRAMAPGLVVALLIGLATRPVMRYIVLEHAYAPQEMGERKIIDRTQAEFFSRARPYLPADSLVYADPFNGSTFLYPIWGVSTVYRYLSSVGVSELNQYLSLQAANFHRDAFVCQKLENNGINYFFISHNVARYQQKASDTEAGRQGLKRLEKHFPTNQQLERDNRVQILDPMQNEQNDQNHQKSLLTMDETTQSWADRTYGAHIVVGQGDWQFWELAKCK